MRRHREWNLRVKDVEGAWMGWQPSSKTSDAFTPHVAEGDQYPTRHGSMSCGRKATRANKGLPHRSRWNVQEERRMVADVAPAAEPRMVIRRAILIVDALVHDARDACECSHPRVVDAGYQGQVILRFERVLGGHDCESLHVLVRGVLHRSNAHRPRTQPKLRGRASGAGLNRPRRGESACRPDRARRVGAGASSWVIAPLESQPECSWSR